LAHPVVILNYQQQVKKVLRYTCTAPLSLGRPYVVSYKMLVLHLIFKEFHTSSEITQYLQLKSTKKKQDIKTVVYVILGLQTLWLMPQLVIWTVLQLHCQSINMRLLDNMQAMLNIDRVIKQFNNEV